MSKMKKSKLAKKINLMSWLYLFLCCIDTAIYIFVSAYYTKRFNNNEDAFFNVLNINIFFRIVLLNFLFDALVLVFLLATSFIKKDYKVRTKSLFIDLIITFVFGVELFIFVTNGTDFIFSKEILNELPYLSVLVLSLVYFIIGIVITLRTLKISKPIKEERRLAVKSIKEEKKAIKEKKIQESKAIKEQMLKDKIIAREKANEERRIAIEKANEERKNAIEKASVEKKKAKEERDNIVKQDLELKMIEKNKKIEKIKMKKFNDYNDDFFKCFNSPIYSALQVISALLSFVGGFGCMMLGVFVGQAKRLGEGLFDGYENNLTPVIVMIVLIVVFCIGAICAVVFTILKNNDKLKAYRWFIDNREVVETNENIKRNYNSYKKMVKEYFTIYGLFYTNKNGKIKSKYNMLTFLYAVMVIIAPIVAIYLANTAGELEISSTLQALTIFGGSLLFFGLFVVYIEILIERIFKQKIYFDKDIVYLKNNEIEIDGDEKFMEFGFNDLELKNYSIRISKKRNWLSYIFAFPSSAILVGIPMIFILLVIFVILMILYLMLVFLDKIAGTNTSDSFSNRNSQAGYRNAENIRGFDGQPIVVFKDINRVQIIPDENKLIDVDTGREYSIYNYHAYTGYFEDENGNVYYDCANKKFLITNEYRHYGESEYEADDRIHSKTGFTR